MRTARENLIQLVAMLEVRKREDGTGYVGLAENAPDWMRDMVMRIHGDSLPCDAVYSMLLDLAVALDERADDYLDADAENLDALRDVLPEVIDGQVPAYYSELKKWEFECGIADESICQALENGFVDLTADDFSIHKIRQAGYYVAADGIAHAILTACENNIDDDAEGDE